MKKRIRVMILALALTVSMIAPEFSMLPAAYAEDQGASVEQAEQADDSAGAAAGAEQPGDAGSAAEGGTASQEDKTGDAAGPATDKSGAEDIAPADNTGSDSDASGTDSEISGDNADPGSADRSDTASEGTDINVTDPSDGTGEEVNPEEGEDEAEETPEPVDIDAYGEIRLTDLDDKGGLIIPDELKESIKTSHTEYGNGVLFKGTVADLNALRIGINGEFDFDKGSAGRLTFDGLKDKDSGMTVEVLVYLDDEEEPVSSFPLNKQMGKKEWSNKGAKTVSLGSREITGKHKVSLGLNITGKKETAKTSVSLRSLQFCITTVPIMYFNIDETEGTVDAMNSSDDHSVECYGSVDLIVPDTFNSDTRFHDEYSEQDSLEGLKLEYIRGRGNSTWSADKKPYKVKFAKKQNLFGFGANSHWVLLANRFDNSLVRNRMTYWLGQQLGMEYTPQCVPVEVVMNGEFYGSYLLCEQIRIGDGRVEIQDLDKVDTPELADDVIKSGGYLLSLDDEEDEDRLFHTTGDARFYIESPDDNVKIFGEYIKAFTQKVENAIMGDNFKDADGNPYTDYLDIDAAVDYWWIQEFSANGDAYLSGSTYLYKKRDDETCAGKLYWGPLWDFDFVAWGDLDYGSDAPEDLNYTSHTWFEAMKTDPVFVGKVKTRWTEEGGLRDKLVEITREGGLLDRYIDQMETSYDYDHQLWGPFDSELTEYKAEVEQLRTWILQRMEYTDAALKEMSVEPHTVKFTVDGKTVKSFTAKGILRASDFPNEPVKKGKVFTGWYTKDGTRYSEGDRVISDLVLIADFVDETEVVQAKKIYFNQYEAYYAGSFEGYDNEEWYWVDYEVMPEDAWDTAVKWSSSNEELAVPDEDGSFRLKGFGDVTLTAKLANGVKRSLKLHIIPYSELVPSEGFKLNKTTLELKKGSYAQVLAKPVPEKTERPEIIWLSANEKIATVDDFGLVKGVKAGTTNVMAVDIYTRQVKRCKVTVKGTNKKKEKEKKKKQPVKPKSYVGKTVTRSGNTYKITSDKKGKRYCTLIKAKNAKRITIPATIKYNKRTYSINKIKAKAFAKSKARRVTIKTKKLTKAGCRNALLKSRVKWIKVKVGKAKVNRSYVKKYRKIFTKKNAGRWAKVL